MHLWGMSPIEQDPEVLDVTRELLFELLRTGLALADVLGHLIDELPDEAFPGEDPGEVVLEMAVGTCAPAVASTGLRETRTSTALIGAAGDRIMDDLETVARLVAEREGGESG